MNTAIFQLDLTQGVYFLVPVHLSPQGEVVRAKMSCPIRNPIPFDLKPEQAGKIYRVESEDDPKNFYPITVITMTEEVGFVANPFS
jgi:hypothetical protein